MFEVPGIGANESDLQLQIYAQGYKMPDGNVAVLASQRDLLVTVTRLPFISGRVLLPDDTPLPADTQVQLSLEREVDPDDDEGTRWRSVTHGVEWYWTDTDGHALDLDGKPDPRFEKPNASRDTDRGFDAASPPVEGAIRAFRVFSLPEDIALAVTANVAGYAPGVSEAIQTSAGSWHQGLVLKLSAGATLQGTVTDPDGKPVENARVSVSDTMDSPIDLSTLDLKDEAFDPAALPEQGTWSLNATTDAAGRWSIPGVRSGIANLVVSAGGFQPHSSTVDVPEAGSLTHDVQLAVGPTISGRILLAGSVPAANASLAVQRDTPDFNGVQLDWQTRRKLQMLVRDERQRTAASLQVEVDAATGEFVVSGLAPGRYRLAGTAPGGTPRDVIATAGDAGVDILLGPVGSLEGVVRLADGSAPQSGQLVLSDDANHQHAFAFTAGADEKDPERPDSPNEQQRQADSLAGWHYDPATGEFRVQSLAPGNWTVAANCADSGVAVLSDIRVTAGEITRVELVLGGLYSLEVTVRDSNGIGVIGARVTIQPENTHRPPQALGGWGKHTRWLETDANGVVRFDDVVWPLNTVRVNSADGGVPQVPVDLRTRNSLEIRFGTPGTIIGVVKDAAGQPSPGITVRGYSQVGQQQTVETDDKGEFRMSDLMPGVWTLQTGKGFDGQGNYRVVWLNDGETVHVELGGSDEATVLVSGTVTQAGKPVAINLHFLRTAGQPRQHGVRSDADGHYEVELEPGQYMVTCDGRYSSIVVPPDVSSAVIDIAFGGCVVRGVVTDPQGQPVSGVQVQLIPAATTNTPTDTVSLLRQVYPGAQSTTGADGRYAIDRLEPGLWDIIVQAGVGNAVTSDGKVVPTDVVGTGRVAEGETIRDIRIESTSGSLRLILTGFPAQTLLTGILELRDPDGRRIPVGPPQMWRSQITGDDETYHHIGSGNYLLHVYIRGSARSATPVQILPGQVAEVRLHAQPGCRLVVNLPTAPGGARPVAWRLLGEDGRDVTPPPDPMALWPGQPYNGLADGEPLVIRDVPAGRYIVEITTSSGRRLRAPAEAGSGTTTITIDLR